VIAAVKRPHVLKPPENITTNSIKFVVNASALTAISGNLETLKENRAHTNINKIP